MVVLLLLYVIYDDDNVVVDDDDDYAIEYYLNSFVMKYVRYLRKNGHEN